MKQHNYDNLTPEQVGVSEGWRLLDEDEIIQSYPTEYNGLQAWTSFNDTKSWHPDFCGASSGTTYRTKLARAELRVARGLPPESEQNGAEQLMQELIRTGKASYQKPEPPKGGDEICAAPVTTLGREPVNLPVQSTDRSSNSGSGVQPTAAATYDPSLSDPLPPELAKAAYEISYRMDKSGYVYWQYGPIAGRKLVEKLETELTVARDLAAKLKVERDGFMYSGENWELMHAKRHEELEAMTKERDELRAVLDRANPPLNRAYECLEMLDRAGMGQTSSSHGNTLTGMVQEICEKLTSEHESTAKAWKSNGMLEARNQELMAENSRLAVIANDSLDKTLLAARINELQSQLAEANQKLGKGTLPI